MRDGAQWLYHVDGQGQQRPVAEGLASDGAFEVEPYLAGGGEFCACPQGVVTVVAEPDDPGRLVLIDRVGNVTDLDRPNAWLQSDVALGRCERVQTERAGGNPLQSWLIYPPDYDPERSYPLILEIHGGPDLAFGGHFAFRAQRYAAEGYLVLMPNYRGSVGTDLSVYDRSYRFPDGEERELLASIETAVACASVDRDRLFVTGLSAGGQLPPGRQEKSKCFRAAAVRGPVINWISHSLICDIYSIFAGRSFGATPWDDPLLHWRHSPLSLAGAIDTPTLIIHGEEDMRTPVAEGMQLFHALKLRGVPAALLLLPGAAHVSTMPSHWLEEQNFILEWFARHGKPTG